MANSGLPRLSGGIAARERAAWNGPCSLPSCTTGESVAGVVDALRGPVGFCGPCCDRAEAKGHTIRREPLTRAPRTRRGARQIDAGVASAVAREQNADDEED
jgi:hypothetical protein